MPRPSRSSRGAFKSENSNVGEWQTSPSISRQVPPDPGFMRQASAPAAFAPPALSPLPSPSAPVVSPTSFRLQLERLASEYECLHSVGQTLMKENVRLRRGGGETSSSALFADKGCDMESLILNREALSELKPAISEHTPREIPNESATSDGIQDGVREVSTRPADIMSKGMAARSVKELAVLPTKRVSLVPMAKLLSETGSAASVGDGIFHRSSMESTLDGMPRRLSEIRVNDAKPDNAELPPPIMTKLRTLDSDNAELPPPIMTKLRTLDSARNSVISCYSNPRKEEEEDSDSSRFSGLQHASDEQGSELGATMMAAATTVRTTARLFPKWFDPGTGRESEVYESEVSWSDKYNSLLDDYESPSDCGTISPVNSFRLTWDFLGFMQLLTELWIVPFELVFLDACETPQAFPYISWTVTIFFAVDIVLNFFTGFVEGDIQVMDRRRIVRQYLRCWFWIDLMATIPWDLMMSYIFGGMLSAARLGKASKFVKTFRYLKMIRLFKLVKVSEQASTLSTHFQLFASLRHTLTACKVVLSLLLYAHIHGCLWAVLQPEWVAVNSVLEAFFCYLESFWWAYTAVTGGSLGAVGLFEPRTQSPGIFVLEMVMATERMLLFVLASMKVSFQALRYVDDARSSHQRMDVLKYLRKHNVSFQTQIQVLFSLKDTARSQKLQSYFDNMAAELLPRELHRNICAELWKEKILSLGLLSEVADWHIDFATELSQLCREEVLPSKALLFRAGEQASFAYHIIQGDLKVDHAPDGRRVPNFRKGMWVGENALVSSLLRRSATFTSTTVTSLMVVHGDSFREVLGKLFLVDRFQQFCSEHLWRGLCGRCGVLGDHFSDSCAGPRVTHYLTMRGKNQKRRLYLETMRGQAAMHESEDWSENTSGMRDWQMANSLTLDASNGLARGDPRLGFRNTSRELQRFLADQEMLGMDKTLLDLGVYDLSDLEALDLERLREQLTNGLTPAQEIMLQPEAIAKFKETQASKVQNTLFQSVSKAQHLMFLSHYKVEAGTEAALLRTEIEQALAKDATNLGQHFQQPVFLDSEDLNSLEALQQHVRRTHNLVLLLTKNVLTRPWVLVEIVTAWKEGTRLQPVVITKPGAEFTFPDADYYTHLRKGTVLDQPSRLVLTQHGFSEDELADSIHAMFQQIAVTYSPHKAGAIRQAEVEKLLKNCRLRSNLRESAAGSAPERDTVFRTGSAGSQRHSRTKPSSFSNSVAGGGAFRPTPSRGLHR